MAIDQQQKLKEIIQCGKDPSYFINKYVYIQHPVRGLIKFKTFKYQDDCLIDFEKHVHNILLKSRQTGISTLAAAYSTWMAIFYKDKSILVIATKLTTAQNFIKKVKVALANLPPWLVLPKIISENRSEIRFDNGSSITAVPTSDDAGRSESLSLLIVDECAFIRDFEEIWSGVFPTLSTGGRSILISTPNGVGGQYHRLWVEAEAGVNEFNPIKLQWDCHPERDALWYENTRKNMSAKKFAREYLCVAEGSRIVTPSGFEFVENLKIGDLVLTDKGRFRKIQNVVSRFVDEDERICQVISPLNVSRKVVMTADHPILSQQYYEYRDNSLESIVRHNVQPKYIPVCEHSRELSKSTIRTYGALFPKFKLDNLTCELSTIDLAKICTDTVAFDDQTCRYYRQWGQTQRYVNVDFELGKFIGFYLAEGCSHKSGIDLGFHRDEFDTHAKFCDEYMTQLGCRVTRVQNKFHKSCRVWTFNKHVKALVDMFIGGRYANEKVLRFDNVLKTNVEFVKGLLLGHFFGDGQHAVGKRTSVYSTSEKLIYQLRTLYSMFGLLARLGHVKHSHKNIKHFDGHLLEFMTFDRPLEELFECGHLRVSGSKSILFGDFFYGRHKVEFCDELKQVDGGLKVFDIQVEDDSSFVVESIVAHNCNFSMSGETFIQAEDMEWILSNIVPPIQKLGEDHGVWLWKVPESSHAYVLSADVARGDSADYSTFHIIDVTTGEVVAEYRGKMPPDRFGELIARFGMMYNKCIVCPENNTFGFTTCMKLKELKYPRLYYQGSRGGGVLPEYAIIDDSAVPGFSMQRGSRIQVLSKLEESLSARNKSIKVYSQRLYNELQTFVWTNGKAAALRDSNDDLVMSLAIGAWISDFASSSDVDSSALSLALLKSSQCIRREIVDTPLAKMNVSSPLTSQMRAANLRPVILNNKMGVSQDKNNTNHIVDYSWLLK